MATLKFSSTMLFQEVSKHLHSRKLILQSPEAPSPSGIGHDSSGTSENSFDANVVMVLSVLLCALIGSLVLNLIIRYVLQWTSVVSADSEDNRTTKLTDTGIPKKALKMFPKIKYTPELKSSGLAAECVICLSDFIFGQSVRVLSKCHHGFHVRCIDKWLNSHSSCPTCRQCLVEICQKIVGYNEANISVVEPPPVEETLVRIVPLEPEGLMHNHQT